MKSARVAGLAGCLAFLLGCDLVVDQLVDASAEVDPEAVSRDFEETFGVSPPDGYQGGLSFEMRVLGRGKKLVSLIPEHARPEEIFEGGRALKFNPGPYTIAVGITLDLGGGPEEMARDFQRFLAENGGGSDFSRIFVEVGPKRLAAYEHVGETYGQTNRNHYFLLDDGRLVLVTGPEADFDHAFRDAMAARLAASHPANELLYAHLEPPTRDPFHPCGFRSLREPFEVHAIGVRRGAEELEGRAIDPEDDDLYAQSVVVGATERPVVLVLMGGEPIVWKVATSAEARLAGVLATGRGVQRVIGLPPDVPLNEVEPGNPNGCPPFYADEDDWERGKASERIYEALARDAKQFHARHSGAAFQIGKPGSEPRMHPARSLESVLLDPSEQILPGRLGLRQLEEAGVLRKATAADLGRWVEVAAATGKEPKKLDLFRRTTASGFARGDGFVVQRETRLPLGMAGANSASFVVAEGIADLQGDLGHNTILYADGRCVGPGCPR